MTERKFQPGFRLSTLDVVVLIAGLVASVAAMQLDRWLSMAIAFVVLHFFLFCNVLRMSRPLELVWAGIFVALSVATIGMNLLPWAAVFGVAGVVTVIVAVIEMRRPWYHGVGWRRINPRLEAWWQAHASGHGN